MVMMVSFEMFYFMEKHRVYGFSKAFHLFGKYFKTDLPKLRSSGFGFRAMHVHKNADECQVILSLRNPTSFF